MGKVLKGWCEGHRIKEKTGFTGKTKGIYIENMLRNTPLDVSTVKSWQKVSESGDKDAVDMGLRGLGGWLILGPLGGLIGAATTKAEGAIVAIEFKNGKKALVQMEQKLFGFFSYAVPPGMMNAIPEPPTRKAPPLPVAPSDSAETKNCPFCAETIKLAAIVCKHCGRDLPSSAIPNSSEVAKHELPRKPTDDNYTPETIKISSRD